MNQSRVVVLTNKKTDLWSTYFEGAATYLYKNHIAVVVYKPVFFFWNFCTRTSCRVGVRDSISLHWCTSLEAASNGGSSLCRALFWRKSMTQLRFFFLLRNLSTITDSSRKTNATSTIACFSNVQKSKSWDKNKGCWSILIFSTEAPSVILLVSTSSFLLSAYLVAFSKILLLWMVS